MLPRSQLPVEVLVVARLLLEDQGAPGQQERETVRGHRPVNVDLVLVLQEKRRESQSEPSLIRPPL